MSTNETALHISFYLSLSGLSALIFLTACQPLIKAQTGKQTNVPVIEPLQDKSAPTTAGHNQPAVPASTALTAQDIAVAPLQTNNPSVEQPVNQVDSQSPEEPIVEIVHPLKPQKPYIKPTFNPADLVGRSHSYVGAQFGKADFNRIEGVIYVLQYHQPDCVIDLFVKIDGTTDAQPSENATILGWAMRVRTINQPLNQTLCQQQFYERKL
tara:strand:+ start:253 stop:885 length:633 start_codon:yes stop_codon:yes gene_type:complete